MKLSELYAYRDNIEEYNVGAVRIVINHKLTAFEVLNRTHDVDPNTNNAVVERLQDMLETLEEIESEVSIEIHEINRKIDKLSAVYLKDNMRIYKELILPAGIKSQRVNRVLEIYPSTRDEVKSRMGLYANWKYPGLEIGPGDGIWTEHLVSHDPLYVVDLHTEFLESTKEKFSPEYQKRLRTYKTIGTDLSMLPQGQMAFVFSWNTFNFFPLEIIKEYLISINKVLRPGGVVMFSYNNSERPKQMIQCENAFMCYTPKSLLIELVQTLGFEILNTFDRDSLTSWIEIKKAGELSTCRAAPALGEIISSQTP